MEPFNWICPYCEHAVTITREKISSSTHELSIDNAEGDHVLETHFLVCPNPECQRFSLQAFLCEAHRDYKTWNLNSGEILQRWDLIPDSHAKNFPDYVPVQIREDYREACLIKDLSPKASATLARRCLQGMIRDFWAVKPGRLVDEIAAIQSRVDPLTWDAIEAVRKIGNIGAHMEKDINVIVDVDPGEADLMIQLIETLIKEWYINREERRVRMEQLVATAEVKNR